MLERVEDSVRDVTTAAVSAEYFALQGLRAATVSESGMRATIFFASVTGVLIALGLLASAVSRGSLEWIVIGASAFLGFVGLTSFLRIVELSIEDVGALRAMNRLRRWLSTRTPEAGELIRVPPRPDQPGIEFVSTGAREHPLRILYTLGTTVGTVNATQLGVGVGLILDKIGADAAPSVAVGALVGVGLAASQARYQLRRYGRAMDAWSTEAS